MLVQRHGDWLSAQVGEEVVMMSAAKGNYIGLNAVGARIWEMIESPQPLDMICARLMEEFDVAPDVCRAEVQQFLDELVRHEAVAFGGVTAA